MSMGLDSRSSAHEPALSGGPNQLALPNRVPPSIAPALTRYLDIVSGQAPGLLSGFYLIGSIALDAFQEGCSDVDFVAILSREATASDIALLRNIHRQIACAHPNCKMDGHYWQAADLRRMPQQAILCPSYTNGKFLTAHSTLSPVDWWLLERRGVAVLGPQPVHLGLAADWGVITRYMITNLNTYWRSFTCRPVRLAWLLSDEGVQWAVLGISRLWYALCEGEIPSKLQAGEYMLARAPERWCSIVAEGIALRYGERSRYRSRLARTEQAVGFVKYTIEECNRRFGGPLPAA